MTNRSCALTRRPIYSYDDARVIFLVQNPNAYKYPAGAIHPTGAWAPISMPLRLKIEDYASDFTPWGEPQASAALFLDGIVRLNFKTIAMMISNRTPVFQGRYTSPLGGLMAMHEAAYQRMIRDFYDCGDTLTPAEIAEQNQPVFEALLAGKREFPDTCHLHYWFEACYTDTTFSPAVSELPKELGPRALGERLRALGAEGAGLDHPEVVELIRETCEMFVLQENMTKLSIPYGPGMISSDDFDTGLVHDLYEIALYDQAAD